MPFKFKDLIITLLHDSLGHEGVASCGIGTGCAGGTGTVGSCTSECGEGMIDVCNLSDEVLDPLAGIINPRYMNELRLMLRLAVAQGRVARLTALEGQMVPQTLQEVEMVEGRLKEALSELDATRQRLLKEVG